MNQLFSIQDLPTYSIGVALIIVCVGLISKKSKVVSFLSVVKTFLF